MGHHAFTVDEANKMLSEVQAALDQIQNLRDVARSKMDQLAVLDALWGDLVSQVPTRITRSTSSIVILSRSTAGPSKSSSNSGSLTGASAFRLAVSSTGWSTFPPL